MTRMECWIAPDVAVTVTVSSVSGEWIRAASFPLGLNSMRACTRHQCSTSLLRY